MENVYIIWSISPQFLLTKKYYESHIFNYFLKYFIFLVFYKTSFILICI